MADRRCLLDRRALAALVLAALSAVALSGPARAVPAARPGAPAPPLPPPRPHGLDGAAPVDRPPPPSSPISANRGECLDRLRGLGVAVETLPPIADGPCRVDHPLRVTRIGAVAIGTDVRVVCPMAEALTRWVADVVAPAAQERLGRTLTGVTIGTSYACRGRNRIAGAKLSEHGAANATDVATFAFDKGPPIAVTAKDPATPEGRFVADAHAGACRVFMTVLGPGSDAYHADHLHLDMQPRRNDYRICQ